MTAGTVALVDDDDDLRAATAQLLRLEGHDVLAFGDGESALRAIGADFAGIVVTDVRMPRLSGIELFRALHDRDADLPVILVTGHGDIAMAVDALKAGAWDFLSKPFEPEALVAAVARGLTARALTLDNRRLRALAEAPDASPMVGDSPAIRQLRDLLPMLAEADMPVLIEGETGTGKELYARLLHRGGRRRRHRFVAIACAALPEALTGGALFEPDGVIASAHLGTLFLDDIDRAPPAIQAGFARFVEEGALGEGARRRPVDMRVVATMAEGGATAVEPALLYRLAAVRLTMPALRQRREDIPVLLAHLIGEAAARLRMPVPVMGAATRQRWAEQEWPGNIRELGHFAERLCLGLDADATMAEDAGATLPDRLDRFERAAILDAIAAAKGDMGAAIAALGLARKTFYYRAKRLGIDLKKARGR
jgi:two-component system C4-dicarboxylate transport response regulator DctD